MSHNPEAEIVHIGTVTWTHDRPGSNQTIEVPLLSNHRLFGKDKPEDPLFFSNGYGEKGWSEEQALRTAAEEGVHAIVGRANVEQVDATVEDITSFGKNYVPHVARYIGTNFYSDHEGVDTVGESMGGAFLGMGLVEAPEELDATIFSQPVSHDVAYLLERFPDDDRRRRELLVRRFPRVVFRPYTLTGEGGFRGPREATLQQFGHAVVDLGLAQFAPDILLGRINPSFDTVAHRDRVGIGKAVLTHAADGHVVGYVFGGKDPLVREPEVRASLRMEAADDPRLNTALDHNVQFHTTPKRRHGYMGFLPGVENFRIAINMLDSTPPAPVEVS